MFMYKLQVNDFEKRPCSQSYQTFQNILFGLKILFCAELNFYQIFDLVLNFQIIINRDTLLNVYIIRPLKSRNCARK